MMAELPKSTLPGLVRPIGTRRDQKQTNKDSKDEPQNIKCKLFRGGCLIIYHRISFYFFLNIIQNNFKLTITIF